MIFLCIGLVFFTLFVIMVSADPRRFVNAVLLLFSIGFLFLGLVIASSAIPFLNYVIIILTLCIPLGLLFLIVLLFHNSVIMIKKSSPKKCVNCSQLKMILSCRLLGHLFDDLFMIVVVGKHIEHTAACAPFIMLIDQD